MTHNETRASADLLRVEEVLKMAIRSSNSAPQDLGNRLIQAGGKRLRPFLLCLTYRSLLSQNGHSPRGSEEDLQHLAAVSELVHTATLFHDDVLDHSDLRRGMPAAHTLEGNKTAVLVGDFVYAEAFYVLMERGLLSPSKELAHTVKTLVDGELLQHQMCQQRSLNRKDYDDVAKAKTGTLFGWCTGTGAWLAGSPQHLVAKDFGRTLGFAFQMADDLIDTFEMDSSSASDSELLAWLDSAPPLPLVIAAEDPKHREELAIQWREALAPNHASQRASNVQRLQDFARASEVVNECLDEIHASLTSVKAQLSMLGLGQDLGWAVDRIWERALQGAKLAEASPAQRKNHGLL